jgi:tetratricopeptide (TPR) repeat protein
MARVDPQRLEERAGKLRALLEKDPADAATWFGLARTLLELGRPGEAIVPLRRALGIDPGYTAAHRDLGRALLESGSVEEATAVLEGGRGLAERNGDLQTGREIEVLLRRAARALGEKPPPAQRKPARGGERLAGTGTSSEATDEARALYRQGFQHFANDRFDEAISLFRKALEIDPALAIAWNGVSMAHRLRGELEEAIEAGLRLIELEPDDALSHTNLSILYQMRGMIPEAEEERAIAMQLLMRSQTAR